MRFQDKVVVITGSSTGIGKAAAIKFAKEGARVVVNFRSNVKEGEVVVKQIKQMGRDVILVKADVSDPDQVKNLFSQTVKELGTVDILFNNAGLARAKPFLEITKEDLEKEMGQNYFGTFYCCQEAVKIMKEKGGGKIINMSSICGGVPHMGCSSILTFTPAKAAVSIFTKTLAQVVGSTITVNAVAPGYVKTRYWDSWTKEDAEELLKTVPVKRWITPEEVADAVVYLAGADGVTGEVLVIDGGASLK